MPFCFPAVIIALIPWVGIADAQEQSHYLVYLPSSPPEHGTGAFYSVCIDQAEGIELLRKYASDIRWGTGANMTTGNAAQMLPFFGSPALVTSECLGDLESSFQQNYERELVVRELN